MTYLIMAHAKHGGWTSDDAATVGRLKNADEIMNRLGLKEERGRSQRGLPSTEHREDGFFPPEAAEWKTYGELEKCNRVMEAQRELRFRKLKIVAG